VTGFILCFSVAGGVAGGKSPLKIGDTSPRIDLTDTKGSNVRIPDDLRGKVVILQFWASGCSACNDEMSAMQALSDRYGRKGLIILAINVGQRKDIVKKWLQDMRISYPVLLDPDKEMARRYDVVDMPRSYLIDRKGIIRYKILGNAPRETMQKKILTLL
jgi:peroxiredoxin